MQSEDPLTTPCGPRQFPCSSCGATLTFNAASAQLSCAHCGFENRIPRDAGDIEELDYDLELQRLVSTTEQEFHAVISCESCGADTTHPQHITADRCPFCDTPFVHVERRVQGIRPAAILPFKITREQARDRFSQWLDGLWMAPGDLADSARQVERLRGLYVPYWMFSTVATSFYSGQRGRVARDSEGHESVTWRYVIGWVKDVLDWIRVPAGCSLSVEELEALEPWDVANLVPYDDRYLSGFEAESHDHDLADAFKRARAIMDVHIRLRVEGDIGGDRQRIREIKTQHERLQFKHVLMPVWISSYRYKGRLFRFVVNGRSGAVHGDRPHDFWKVAGALAGGLVAACGIGTLLMWFIQNSDSETTVSAPLPEWLSSPF